MSDPRAEQSVRFAHLRSLPRCRDCGKPATEAVYSGLNAHVGDYCSAHAKRALERFKAAG